MNAQQSGLAPVKRRPDIRWAALSVDDVVESPGITISESHLVQWAGLTGDWVSLHLDDQYAAETPFGERIAHGPLTLSLGLGLLTQTGYFSNVAAWLGVDEVRALSPVLIGDTIRVRATVVESRPTKRADRGLWTLAYDVVNQRGATVMTFRSSFLVLTDEAQPVEVRIPDGA